ncbi:glycine betaine ABC transporter substrate-binding protein [Lentilactobacillus farraginis]|uniref:Glycine betaine ABC superfamily ATP binding cassette transporter, binding protein n=1 Tax=Lentilactobacillus farraginis DSM 18382 = JCM 14108 TaxID=1423743 RepID=X0PHD0_9LACO|nr:glycine betaine ABC transporter substrate-binding protein [Lentilactobacillus farraginis]KRM09512.1 glycine betaine ABC superfamily ATP binding cassette transporter, binding protein [Lentilactobacillus farraginis DSM 18382 = JCM 14108]GAF36442.1 glycine betaine ABC transport system, glycine betaine-binding protein OpuAC [Lentilactobacillus farraginis DSM 18382 = JCM 14108]
MKKSTSKLLIFISVLFSIILLSGCSSQMAKYNPKESVGKQINYTITGIEAGAGEMATTQKAMKAYGLDKGNWQLQTSSTAAMLSTLGKSIRYKQPIVITGWTPHWMFTKYKLKFLKDPKNIYGKTEDINTIVRKGLKKDKPEAYELLNRFHWNPEQMSAVMLKVNGGESPRKAANDWIKQNKAQVNTWTKGIKHVKGQKIKLTYVAWDSEIASTNVVANALRTLGYQVTIQAMELQPMWTSIATKAADGTVSAWLPNTQGLYYKDFKGRFDDLGENLHGAKVGLAVPTYMKNVNTISDLK